MIEEKAILAQEYVWEKRKKYKEEERKEKKERKSVFWSMVP